MFPGRGTAISIRLGLPQELDMTDLIQVVYNYFGPENTKLLS